tara:strand:- start:30 stop:392 length:363 start_codon:yes stop_codon:yes gene_type:complete
LIGDIGGIGAENISEKKKIFIVYMFVVNEYTHPLADEAHTMEQQEEAIHSLEVYIHYLKSKVDFLEQQIEDMRNKLWTNTTNTTNLFTDYDFLLSDEEDNEYYSDGEEMDYEIEIEEVEL